MIYIGPKFLSALMIVTLGLRSHSYNFKNVKVFVYVFKILLIPNLITELIHLWFDEYFAHCNQLFPEMVSTLQAMHVLFFFVVFFYGKYVMC